MLRIVINDPNLILDDKPTNWGERIFHYNGELFGGIMYEYFPDSTQLSSESEYKDGIPDGRQVDYWPNGKIKCEMFEKYEDIYGSFKKWNEQGVLILHQEHDNFGNLIKKII